MIRIQGRVLRAIFGALIMTASVVVIFIETTGGVVLGWQHVVFHAVLLLAGLALIDKRLFMSVVNAVANAIPKFGRGGKDD